MSLLIKMVVEHFGIFMEWDVYVWFCFESDNLGGRFQFLKHQLHDASENLEIEDTSEGYS